MSRADSLLRPFGEYEPTISSCKYYHDLCLSFNLREPIKKDDSFVIIEESDRVFKSDHLKFFAIHPSGPKKIMLVFREIKPKNLYFKKQFGHGTVDQGSLQVQEQQEGIFILSYSWKPSTLGETLFIYWSWPTSDFLIEE